MFQALARPAARVAIMVAAGILGGILALPSSAEACSWNPQEVTAQLPADGQVAGPDTSIVALMDSHLWRSVQPVLIDEDGGRIAVPVPEYPLSFGSLSDLFTLYIYQPDEDLAPGTYTLTFEYNGHTMDRTTTFEVVAKLSDSLPEVSDFEWMTRVFDDTMDADSCSWDYLQESRLRFSRPRALDDERQLFYRVRMSARGEFDGHVEREESGHRKLAVVAEPQMRYQSGQVLPSYSRFEGDEVTVTVNTAFKVECVEIHVSDLSGNESEVVQRCVPDRCVSAQVPDYRDDFELLHEIDWSNQPDCSEEYPYCEDLGDCGGSGGDAGHEADAGGDTGAGDAGDDVADGGPDIGDDASGGDTGESNETERDIASGGAGCACSSPPGSRATIPMMLISLLGLTWCRMRRVA